MRSVRLLLALTFSVTACSGGDDDDGKVMIPDSGVRDGGAVDQRDGGVLNVDLANLAAGYTLQGCDNPMLPPGCQIWSYRVNVTLGNLSQYFAIKRVTGVRIEVGTFVFEQTNVDCDGTWWKAPKMGMTAAQRFTASIFDPPDADMTRPDNATMSWDCKSSEDGVIVPMYEIADNPEATTTVKATMWGEMEDDSLWEATAEATAFRN